MKAGKSHWSLDLYTWKARFCPTVIVALPVALGIFSWFPQNIALWGALAGGLLSAGLAGLLAEVGRDQGKAKEPVLFAMWGGKPSTIILSYRRSWLNSITLRRYHEVLQRVIPGVSIPNSQEEADNPQAADAQYESCVDYLREATRDRRKYPLVFAELASYGFRRNLWAMKPVGIALALLGTVACTASFAWGVITERQEPQIPLASGVFCAVLTTFWFLRFKPSWIRLAAVAYAERLLASCETITSSNLKMLPGPTKSALASRFDRSNREGGQT
ncbi:MAG TPA: hypothetical protein VNA25_16385 [Phycisphaerae bacterium]|nr:hypothetical protein [Phycisphaerae bacterium]